ncbi:tyrosine-type recombinase/integrase [Burkholderia pseudomallei]|uniref:tyrosine-type recombinase/integrase n=1 Tax=Burkholderia pseudomallei TaxID=28450 RepID=UPI000F090A71|nr:site-specific integrase [Burkholderia pseudomallei]CAJ4869691.1 integrase family protein [Burkholderia pseudomallei]CAJ5296661.1 integrase family protein [Burkholderia pseudomallei]CAJ5393189.1 integrase family protein [Burkholderia pseudomallei]CAJ7342425.1 integrase family protein [Burkholderia pseudomallei]VBJ69336.1 integrase family protein [Burkholderia pseudomallei]
MNKSAGADSTSKESGAKLSRPKMRKLAPGEKITERGITFERLRNGDGLFSVNVMIDGQRIHRIVGRESDGTTRTQAEDFIGKLRNDAKHDRLSLPKGRKVALSFRDAAIKYLEKLDAEGGKDIKAKRMRLERHLVPFFADTPLSKISTFDVERFKKQRQQEKSARGGDRVSAKAKEQGAKVSEKAREATPGTINRELAALSHLFSKAVEWGWITHRPAKLSRLKEGDGRIMYLTVNQVAALLEAAKASDNPQLYPFIVIAVETSMRMSEILSIRRENVDVQRRVIYIPKAKAGRREQPVTEHVATFLKEYIEALPPGTPWLFPSAAAKCGHTVEIRRPFVKAVREAGLDPALVVRHTLRHTAITHLVQAGIDLPTVKRISGHKTLAMVERYSHQNGEHIQAAMDKLQDRMKLA